MTATDNDGSTSLHLAARWGHTEIAQALLEAGAEVNATVTDGDYKGWTPRQLAKNDAIRSELQEAGATK